MTKQEASERWAKDGSVIETLVDALQFAEAAIVSGEGVAVEYRYGMALADALREIRAAIVIGKAAL